MCKNDKIKYKEYKTIDEQIEHLKLKQNFIIDDEDIHILEERNYTSLVNPYKRFFASGRNNKGNLIYKKTHNFKELLKIVKINDEYSKLLYEQIGFFEKKFKTILFDEICKKYINKQNEKDLRCISYLDEIKIFFNSNFETLPCFCANYFFSYVKIDTDKTKKVSDEYDIDRKKSVLEKIYKIGSGKNIDNSPLSEADTCKNKLINHYLKTQQKVPLWVIPNALTFGELQTVFKMIDTESQKKIIAKMKNIDSNKILNKEIIPFSGHIETIRQMRNIVNHYEPILPFFVDEMKSKKIEYSHLYHTLILLDDTMKTIDVNSMQYSIESNSANSKPLRILNMMLHKISAL